MAYGIVNAKSSNATSASGVYLADVSNASTFSGNGSISLNWSDPSNVTMSGNTVATWVGTLVIRKEGSVPENRADGTVIINNTVRDAYTTSPLVDNDVTNGTVYYYRFFPYSTDGNYTDGTVVSGKPGSTVVTIPTIASSHTYNTNPQSPILSNWDGNVMAKFGNTEETNANEDTANPYVITVNLTDNDAVWADGTYTAKQLTWNMAKANNIPVLSKSQQTISVTDSGTSFNVTAAGTGTISASSVDTSVATASCPANAGSATVTVTKVGGGITTIIVSVDEDDNYKAGQAYFSLGIVKSRIPVPTISDINKTYTGNEQHPTVTNAPDSSVAQLTGTYAATSVSTAAGNAYTFSYTIINPSNVEWEDGTTETKTYTWYLAQAASTLTASPTSITIANTASGGSFTLGGTGAGGVSVITNSNASILDTAINGNTLTVTKKGNAGGTVTLTLQRAATTNYAASATVQVTVVVNKYRTMTVTINQANSSESTCCTYANDATSMTAGSSDWDTFFGEYPCLMAGGVEGVKLNPNNYAQDINGNTVTITSGNNDVMVAFPIKGLKISTSGDVVTVSMTENPNAESDGFEYLAHMRGSTKKDKFYLGAYMGSEVSSKLRSLKGQTIANNKTIGAFRTLARANSPSSNGSGGSGYDQHGFYQLVYLQAMFVLKYKRLNSQLAVGQGYTKSSNTAQKATGGTETWGLTKTGTGDTDHMKIFGIEDLWGNVRSWIDGLYLNGSRNLLTATQGFNDTGSNYPYSTDSGVSSTISGYLTKVQGTTKGGFVAKACSEGSETTYFCDRSYLDALNLPSFGGHWYNAGHAGVFYLAVADSAAYARTDIGSRLMFL